MQTNDYLEIRIFILEFIIEYKLLVLRWVKNFCNILVCDQLQHLYHMIDAVQVMEGTCGSWCTDRLCIASFCLWFENCGG